MIRLRRWSILALTQPCPSWASHTPRMGNFCVDVRRTTRKAASTSAETFVVDIIVLTVLTSCSTGMTTASTSVCASSTPAFSTMVWFTSAQILSILSSSFITRRTGSWPARAVPITSISQPTSCDCDFCDPCFVVVVVAAAAVVRLHVGFYLLSVLLLLAPCQCGHVVDVGILVTEVICAIVARIPNYLVAVAVTSCDGQPINEDAHSGPLLL
ncbi:unnamed protein product [Polarella glacialis]|uniref:Uncharacterized protein n=1 Tax=Polarella glacialis TaxID=89957 RepID=A0A813ECG9_POLGL|nr:unnamed protein product [Polarella glacialis]